MVFLFGVLAALSLGVGWVLQQRVASHAALSELLSFGLLLHLMHRPTWWLGIAAMVTGQVLGGLALLFGPVSLVEPVLSTNLLFALVVAAFAGRRRPGWNEIVGAVLLSAALAVFIDVGNPQASTHAGPSPVRIFIAAAVVAVLAALLSAIAKRRGQIVESVLIATAAGLLYGLQDAGTRGALVRFERHGLAALLISSPWPYIVFGSAVIGIFLSQSAFGAARLDYSLPPTAATEPITGIALGVIVLGDELSVDAVGLAVEAVCLVAMVAGVILIGRSRTLNDYVPRQEQ